LFHLWLISTGCKYAAKIQICLPPQPSEVKPFRNEGLNKQWAVYWTAENNSNLTFIFCAEPFYVDCGMSE